VRAFATREQATGRLGTAHQTQRTSQRLLLDKRHRPRPRPRHQRLTLLLHYARSIGIRDAEAQIAAEAYRAGS
jgi:hypothetical protein